MVVLCTEIYIFIALGAEGLRSGHGQTWFCLEGSIHASSLDFSCSLTAFSTPQVVGVHLKSQPSSSHGVFLYKSYLHSFFSKEHQAHCIKNLSIPSWFGPCYMYSGAISPLNWSRGKILIFRFLRIQFYP